MSKRPLPSGYLTDEAADMSTPAPQPKRRKPNNGKVIVQREANRMGTPTEHPNRGQAIAECDETEELPAPVQQQNCPKVAVQGESGEMSKVVVNMLCTTCKDIFASAKDRARNFSWHYDILGLIDSATKGCHFCVQVLRKIGSANVESLKREFAELNVEQSKLVEKRLRAETRHYEHMGVAFILRRKDAGPREYLASICLYFAQGIKGEPKINNSNVILTASQGSLPQIHRWIEKCKAEHVMCKPAIAGSPPGQWPSRLLAVGENGNTDIILCETSKIISSTLHYTTLSHCWGDLVPIRLLTTNMSEFLQGIPLDSIPRTFRDAVEMTRALGLSYLWIDAMCILQDSEQDWLMESSRMYEIYRNSYLNLAAVASTNAKGGLIHSSSLLSRIPCNVIVGRGKYQERALTSYTSGTQSGEKNLPLLNRAWVFQEILLPSRVLLFTRDEVCWECNEMSRTETYPEGEPTHQEGEIKAVTNRVIPFRKAWRDISEGSSLLRFELWNKVISHYSRKKMSKAEDKLVAVAGLALDLGRVWPEAEYLGGLWSFDLIHGLLWHCSGNTRTRFYNAPSWSWASVDGGVYLHSHDDSRFCDKLVEVVEARTFHPSISFVYGAVTDGYIRLKGPLIQASIRREMGYGKRYTFQFLDDSLDGAIDNIHVKINIRVSWDDCGFDEIFSRAKPFLMRYHFITSSFSQRTIQADWLV